MSAVVSDPSEPIVSYAQNGEDIVLWRALGDIPGGRYVEVGANDPDDMSISKLFYLNGWSGVEIEPVPEFAERLRSARPRDTVLEVAITDAEVSSLPLHVFDGTGLSTLQEDIAAKHNEGGFHDHELRVQTATLRDIHENHLKGLDVHFCVIDVEGVEDQVLRSADFTTFRPWVLVIEATEPLTSEPSHQRWESIVLDAGYEYCLFDGLSRFYVAQEHAERLKAKLSYPVCILDDYVSANRIEMLASRQQAEEAKAAEESTRRELEQVKADLEQQRSDLLFWRGEVVKHWARLADVAQPSTARDDSAQAELDAIRQTLSWRVTAPLRAVRRRQLGRG